MSLESPFIHIIVQARTGSTRLPNKIMKFLEDKIVLDHVIDRLSQSKYASKVIIATTTELNDNVIVEHCINRNIEVFRGSEKDVLERYYDCATYYNSNIIIRVTSDCPLIDVTYIDLMIEYFINQKLNYLGPKYFGNHKFPDGFNGEVFNYNILKEAQKYASKDEREHVTTYIQKKYKTKEFMYPIDYSKYSNIKFNELHLSLDTIEDYKLLKKIFNKVYIKNNNFKLFNILEFLNDIK